MKQATVPAKQTDATVFIIDDDPAMRESLRWLIEPAGFGVETYADAGSFLSAYDPTRPGCLVLDMRLPGMSGIDLQDELLVRKVSIPIIIISAYAEFATAVRALRSGALDFIEKPFKGQQLLERIGQAIEIDTEQRRNAAERQRAEARLAILSPREREVLTHMLDGKANKAIAYELGLSPKTIEVHRAHVLQKLRVDSMIELSRLALLVGLPERQS
jgi:two-component system, LuxR family, response regulator FixJ